MRLSTTLLTLSFSLLLFSFASAGNFKDFTIVVDSSKFAIDNTIRLDLHMIRRNNAKRVIYAEMNALQWAKWQVAGDGVVSLKNGVLTYDPRRIYTLKKPLTFTLSCEENGLSKTFSISVPYVTRLLFEPFTITVGEPVSPVYRLKLSNGYEVPFDPRFFDPAQIINRSDKNLVSNNNELTYFPADDLPEFCNFTLLDRISRDTLYHADIELIIPERSEFTFAGRNGKSGVSGQRGTMPSESGQNGGAGEDGDNGPDVEVFLSMKQENGKILLTISVVSEGKRRTRIIEYQPGSFVKIAALGGKGGNGGNGGSGQDAAHGMGGNAGNGGNGGTIRVYVNSTIEDSRDYLLLDTRGGTGGRGGSSGIIGRRLNGRDGTAGASGSVYPEIRLDDAEFERLLAEKGF
jgi:hypothetical protein